ncbi:hypothetical protein [uncultured Mobiluncus sp.]|uniref:VOC family protein n=1 Tax=uncultured Mobiluncus sp. TaxID=293425 RepID=UPI00288938F9|nr:hypothetical protein [uncultured Mobiluncus sp.]
MKTNTWSSADGDGRLCEEKHPLVKCLRSSGADWAFFRDPDRNLIEIIDLHVTRLALGSLGCIIGETFKHTTMANFYK